MAKQSHFTEYLRKVKQYYFRYHDLPSFETMMQILSVKSKSVVHRFMQQLVEQGLCVKQGNVFAPTQAFSALPLYESVYAWYPSAVVDEVKKEIHIQSHLVDDPLSTVLIKVQGDSMEDAGIFADDIVIVDTDKAARVGDMVIGIVDGEYTVKFLMKDKIWKLYLQAANSQRNYPNIYAREQLQLFWVVTGSFRRY